MKKSRSGSDHEGCITANPKYTFAEELLEYEILSRLPVKTLMRFKCVCKRWRFLIQKDQYFLELHLTGSLTRPGSTTLVFTLPSDGGMRLYTADLFKDGSAVPRLKNLGRLHNLMRPINGLICFSSIEGGNAVCIYNLSTGEGTPWIKAHIKEEDEEKEREEHVNAIDDIHGHHHQKRIYHQKYAFGFDPSTKQHKVICIWEICEIQPLPFPDDLRDIDEVCEVLTVGHDTWRRIDDAPQYKVQGPGVYVNGSIYWSSRGYVPSTRWKRNNPESYKLLPPVESGEVIVAFDVGSEKFSVIEIPNFILHNPQASVGFQDRIRSLIAVDGCIAYTDNINRCMVKLWIFDDHHGKGKSTTTSATSNTNWIEETISMPFEWYYPFEAIPGSEKLIIRFHEEIIDTLTLYSYDRKQKTFEMVKVSGLKRKTPAGFAVYATYMETLWPVQKQLTTSSEPTREIETAFV